MNCGEYLGTIQNSFGTISGKFENLDGDSGLIITLVDTTSLELWRIFGDNSGQFWDRFGMDTIWS